MTKGLITDIQRASFHDGDGIRTTVFLKGCPLSCLWCHNPECISFEKEVLVYPEKCIGCGLCKQTCPKQVISMVPQETRVVVMCSNKQKGADAMKACKNACIGCKKCAKTCSYGAIKVTDNLARIDYSKCNGCGKCAEKCPQHIIVTR